MQLLLLAGAIADRYGRHRALAAGLAVFAAGSLAAAFTQTTAELIAARAIMGIGGAFIMPATLSIITSVFRRGRAPGRRGLRGRCAARGGQRVRRRADRAVLAGAIATLAGVLIAFRTLRTAARR